METLGFIFVAGALIGYCILRELQASSANDRREQRWQVERDRWRAEREKLLDRIQAPEVAVVAEQQPTQYVAPDDDEGYWQATEEREG